jgi:hypothetical protein
MSRSDTSPSLTTIRRGLRRTVSILTCRRQVGVGTLVSPSIRTRLGHVNITVVADVHAVYSAAPPSLGLSSTDM